MEGGAYSWEKPAPSKTEGAAPEDDGSTNGERVKSTGLKTGHYSRKNAKWNGPGKLGRSVLRPYKKKNKTRELNAVSG